MKTLFTLLLSSILVFNAQASNSMFTAQQYEVIQQEQNDLKARSKELSDLSDQLNETNNKLGTKTALIVSGVMASIILGGLMTIEYRSTRVKPKKSLVALLTSLTALGTGSYKFNVTAEEARILEEAIAIKQVEYEEEYEALTQLKNMFHLENTAN